MWLRSIFIKPIEDFGEYTTNALTGLGDFTQFIFSVFYWTFKPPFRTKNYIDQIYFIGNKSIFIILLTSSFTGMVFAFQTYLGFELINADSFIGPIVAISICKELAPVLSGLVVAGRCGAAMAAQIGTMKVTEQIDALEVMGVSSIQYLAVPRFWATVISMPLLAAIFMLVGNIGSWFIGVKVIGIDEVIYFSKLSEFMDLEMVVEGLIKATIFGGLIALIGTYFGFQVRGGAEGVGKGTNLSVVWGMVLVLVVDYFLTSILTVIL